MKFDQKYSLTKKLFILFAITMIITLGATLIFAVMTLHSLKNEKSRNVENISANLVQNTEDIAASVMLMSETISNASYTHSLLEETSEANKIEYQQLLNRLVTKLIKSTSHIINILLLDNSENIYSFSSFDYYLASKLDRQYHILSPNIYPDGFTGALYLSDTDTTYYAFIQTIYNNSNAINKAKIGTCVIICSCSPLNQLCNNAASSEQTLFAILDADDHILACNQKTSTAHQTFTELDNKHRLIFQSAPFTQTGWTLFCSVPYTELYTELPLIWSLAAILIIILFLSFLLLAHQINLDIISPLMKIVHFFHKGSYYILHNRLEVTGNNEITTLTTNINQMLNEINELTHTVLQNQARLYEIKLAKDQAQLLALQTQINPHFLYNTLNSIQGLAFQGKCTEICTAVASLSYMMRYTINKDSMTHIKNEFLCIEKYLQIINLRFPDRFIFHLNIDDTISDYEMPRFLLQPLVENAISHGLEPNYPQKGTLTLTASLRDDSILHFECIDDGVGIPPDKQKELRQKIAIATTAPIPGPQSKDRSGIGLLNIHMRIQLIYGAPYGLSIYSSPEGTTICADFPATLPAK